MEPREERVGQTVRDNLHAHSQNYVISPEQGQNRFSEAYSTSDAERGSTLLLFSDHSFHPDLSQSMEVRLIFQVLFNITFSLNNTPILKFAMMFCSNYRPDYRQGFRSNTNFWGELHKGGGEWGETGIIPPHNTYLDTI